jgi:hypothetical protein
MGLPTGFQNNSASPDPNSGYPPVRREILTLTIEIGEGQSDDIFIFEGDDPNYLAAEFAAKHGIGEQL